MPMDTRYLKFLLYSFVGHTAHGISRVFQTVAATAQVAGIQIGNEIDADNMKTNPFLEEEAPKKNGWDN